MVFSYKIVFSLQFHCVVFTNNYNLTLAANDLTRSWHNSLWPTEELETYAVVCIGYIEAEKKSFLKPLPIKCITIDESIEHAHVHVYT